MRRSGWIACFFFLWLTCSEARRVKTKHLPTTITGTVCCDTIATSSKQQHASSCTNFISGATVAVECKPDAASKQASFTQVAKTDTNGEFKLSLNNNVHTTNIHDLCHVHLLHSGDSHCAVASKAVSSSFRLLKPTDQNTTDTEYTAGVFTFKPHPETTLSKEIADQKTVTLPNIPGGLPTNLPSSLPPLPDFMPKLPGLPPLPSLPALPALPALPTLPALPSLSVPQITTSISSLPVPKIPTSVIHTKKLLSEKPNFNTAAETSQPISRPQQLFPPIVPPVVPSPPGLIPPVLPSPPGILPPIPLQPPSPPPAFGLPPVLPIPTPPVPGIPFLPPVIPLPSPPASSPPSGIVPPVIPTLPPVIPKLPPGLPLLPGLPLPPTLSSSTSDKKVEEGSSSSSAP